MVSADDLYRFNCIVCIVCMRDEHMDDVLLHTPSHTHTHTCTYISTVIFSYTYTCMIYVGIASACPNYLFVSSEIFSGFTWYVGSKFGDYAENIIGGKRNE